MQRFCVCSDMGSRHGPSERDRGLDGRHQSVAGEAAAKAAQDAAGQAGGSGGDHAACAQRQSGRIGCRAFARVRPLGHGLSVDFAVSGQRFGVLRHGYGTVRPRDPGPADRDRGTHPADPRPDHGLRSPPDPDAERAVGRARAAAGLAGRGNRGGPRLRHATRAAPGGRTVVLLADRFYGTPAMIRWCRDRGWDYRLRLKSNLVARCGTTKTTTGDLALSGGYYFEAVALTGQRGTTNIGIIRDPGHAEPWIIAMSAKPGYLTTLGYADRWGIEPMFSDFKSRGFGLEQTHIQYPDRLSRLILVMSLALYWAVSTGMWDQVKNPTPPEKNDPTISLPSSHEEGSHGLHGASGAPSNSSLSASRCQSSGDAC